MKDGIIAGNGNSRYLKTVAAALSLYPTYQDFMTALIAGTFPIDLNGINQAGWSQLGTALNKANLLSDQTASFYGLGTDATVNSTFLQARTLITNAQNTANSRVQIITGNYVGTGTYGSNSPNSLNFPFNPKLVLLRRRNGGVVPYTDIYLFVPGTSIALMLWGSTGGVPITYTLSNNTLTWYSEDYVKQYNDKGKIYDYVALG